MVQAAAAGIIDFSTIDPFNKRSTLKRDLLLQETSRQIDEKREFAAFLLSIAVLISSRTVCENPNQPDAAAYVTEKYAALYDTILPGEKLTQEQFEQRLLQDATSVWERTHGCKIDGPEVQETARRLKEHFRAAAEATRLAEIAEQEVMQLTGVRHK